MARAARKTLTSNTLASTQQGERFTCPGPHMTPATPEQFQAALKRTLHDLDSMFRNLADK